MSKPNDRDMFGTPKNRSKTWDAKKSRDPKKDRRKSKREPDGWLGKLAKHLIENEGVKEEDDE